MAKIVLTKNVEDADVIIRKREFNMSDIMAIVILSKVLDKKNKEILNISKFPENLPNDVIMYGKRDVKFVIKEEKYYLAILWKKFGHEIVKTDAVFKEVDEKILRPLETNKFLSTRFFQKVNTICQLFKGCENDKLKFETACMFLEQAFTEEINMFSLEDMFDSL